MAKANELRGRGLMKGEGVWRSFMATNNDAVFPEADADDQSTVPYEDVITLNPSSLLSSAKLMRVKRVEPAPLLENGPAALQLGGSDEASANVTAQPVALPEAAMVTIGAGALDLDDDDDEGPLVRTRFGQSAAAVRTLYEDYRRLRKEDRQGACCGSRGVCVRGAVGCTRLAPQRCAVCFVVGLRGGNQLALAGSLPIRGTFDVCVDWLKRAGGCLGRRDGGGSGGHDGNGAGDVDSGASVRSTGSLARGAAVRRVRRGGAVDLRAVDSLVHFLALSADAGAGLGDGTPGTGAGTPGRPGTPGALPSRAEAQLLPLSEAEVAALEATRLSHERAHRRAERRLQVSCGRGPVERSLLPCEPLLFTATQTIVF
jgi:hypothetical protein